MEVGAKESSKTKLVRSTWASHIEKREMKTWQREQMPRNIYIKCVYILYIYIYIYILYIYTCICIYNNNIIYLYSARINIIALRRFTQMYK